MSAEKCPRRVACNQAVEHFLGWWLMWENKMSTIESRAVSSTLLHGLCFRSCLRMAALSSCPHVLQCWLVMRKLWGNKLFSPWATLGHGIYDIDRKQTDIPWSRRPGRIGGGGKCDIKDCGIKYEMYVTQKCGFLTSGDSLMLAERPQRSHGTPTQFLIATASDKILNERHTHSPSSAGWNAWLLLQQPWQLCPQLSLPSQPVRVSEKAGHKASLLSLSIYSRIYAALRFLSNYQDPNFSKGFILLFL